MQSRSTRVEDSAASTSIYVAESPFMMLHYAGARSTHVCCSFFGGEHLIATDQHKIYEQIIIRLVIAASARHRLDYRIPLLHLMFNWVGRAVQASSKSLFKYRRHRHQAYLTLRTRERASSNKDVQQRNDVDHHYLQGTAALALHATYILTI